MPGGELVVLPHDNDFENGVDDADGAKTAARDQALADVTNGRLGDINIAPDAAIQGTKLSTTVPVPGNRIAPKAIDDTRLANDATVDALRAVGTNALKDGAVIARVLGALAVIKGKIKVLEVDWVPVGTIPPTGVATLTTGITATTGIPLLVAVMIAGVPSAASAALQASVHINGSTNTYYFVLYNAGGSTYTFGGTTIRFFYIAAS